MENTSQQFTLYASHGRIYAENSAGKLIDLGAVRKEGNVFAYRLDADGVSGEASESFARALADVEHRITYLYLDSQFTALPDLREKVELPADAPAAVISLTDTVALPQAGGGDTPHIF
jgi:hypothetical protein